MIGFPVAVSAEVAAFHQQALVIDLHNDLLTKISHVTYDLTSAHPSAAIWNPLRLDLDLPKIRSGGIDGLGCLLFAGFRMKAALRFWRQLETVQRLAIKLPHHLALVDRPESLLAAQASGRVALFLGVEGSYVVEDNLQRDIPRLAQGGVRFLGPLWERDSRAGSSCRSTNDQGLSPLGRDLVAACQEQGIALDVAHASRKTFWDMAEVARGALFSSHSAAQGAHAHPRNLDDDQIRAIADRGGVVGVIFVSSYVGGWFASLERVADHIEYMVRVGGMDCIALGSDFDGFMPLVRGMRDAADLPRLTQLLWNRGWREERLRKLLGENALRFFRDTWRPRSPLPGL